MYFGIDGQDKPRDKSKGNKSEKMLGLGFWAYRGNKSRRRFSPLNYIYLGK